MVKPIITIPNPILRERSKVIREINEYIRALREDLLDTLADQKEPKGVGISAPQIGELLRICLVYSKESRRILTMINPEITWKSKRMTKGIKSNQNPYEGCLSVPKLWGLVERHSKIKVRYMTHNGQIVTRRFSGFTGTVIQHEIDHLDGILFVDRVITQKNKLYEVQKNENGEEELVELKLT